MPAWTRPGSASDISRIDVGTVRLPGQRRHANRALVFGGYRWINDVALEGSFATADRYALQPSDAAARRGIGLSLSSTPALSSSTLECRRLYELVVPQELRALRAPGLRAKRGSPGLRACRAAAERVAPPARRRQLRRRRALRRLACPRTAARIRALRPLRRRGHRRVRCPNPTRSNSACSSGSDRPNVVQSEAPVLRQRSRRFLLSDARDARHSTLHHRLRSRRLSRAAARGVRRASETLELPGDDAPTVDYDRRVRFVPPRRCLGDRARAGPRGALRRQPRLAQPRHAVADGDEVASFRR